jgi:hypothetical protein
MRQTGLGELDLAELMREPEFLVRANEEAQRLLDADPELLLPANRVLKTFVEAVLTKPVDL